MDTVAVENGRNKGRALFGEAGDNQSGLELDFGIRGRRQEMDQAIKQAMTDDELLALAVADDVVLDGAQ